MRYMHLQRHRDSYSLAVIVMSDVTGNGDLQNALLRRVDEEVVEGAHDVMSSLHIDHHQISATWNRALAFAIQTSPIKQFGLGFGVGWVSGYLFRRVSRTAAFLVGCSFLAIQGATALGIININWGRLRREAERRMSRVQRIASSSTPHTYSLVERVVAFCHQHVYITSGFATGAVVAITF